MKRYYTEGDELWNSEDSIYEEIDRNGKRDSLTGKNE
jgi:hypothetical protein